MEDNKQKFRTRGGLNYVLDCNLYDEMTKDTTMKTYVFFEGHIEAGEYLPTFMSLLCLLFLLFKNYTSFLSILLITLISSCFSVLLWRVFKLYMSHFFDLLIYYIGIWFLRFFGSYIVILLISIFAFHDWHIIFYYIISKIITSVFMSFTVSSCNVSYNTNNKIAKYSIDYFK